MKHPHTFEVNLSEVKLVQHLTHQNYTVPKLSTIKMANLINFVKLAVFVSFVVFFANAVPVSHELARFVDDSVSDQGIMTGDVAQSADNWTDFEGFPTGR